MQKIYCGPNILKYNLMRYQVFINEVDEYPYNVKEAINEVPEVGRLFCEIDELESMRAKILELGTAENVYNAVVEEKIKEFRGNENRVIEAHNV